MRTAAVSRDLACTVATRRTTTYCSDGQSTTKTSRSNTDPTVCQMTVPSRTECDAYNALWRYNRTVRTGRPSFQFGWSGQPTCVETCPVCRVVGCRYRSSSNTARLASRRPFRLPICIIAYSWRFDRFRSVCRSAEHSQSEFEINIRRRRFSRYTNRFITWQDRITDGSASDIGLQGGQKVDLTIIAITFSTANKLS